LKKNQSKILGIASLAAFVLAVIAGLLAPEFCNAIECVGTIYVNLLKIMIVPVLFTGIASSLGNNTGNVSGITVKTILVFIAMFVVSFLICSALWAVLKPGVGAAFTEVEWDGELTELSLSAFLIALFPNNIITAMSNNSILPVIIFAFVFGIVIEKCKLTRLAQSMEDLSTAFKKMLEYVMFLTPIGVFSLMGNTVANYGSKILGTAAIYIGCAYLGCVVIAVLVMMLPVWIYAGIDPITYIRRVYKVWIMTLTTCSSAAALPNTIKVCNEEFGISENITNLVVPLGCTIHMCGGAVSFSLLAMFNMQMYGMTMTPGLYILMLVLALVINMGAPGIPGGGIVIGATFLSVLGIPITFIGFYAGIYRLLDMAYTTMNVCGDISANILIHKMVSKKIDSTDDIVKKFLFDK